MNYFPNGQGFCEKILCVSFRRSTFVEETIIDLQTDSPTQFILYPCIICLKISENEKIFLNFADF